MSFGVVKVGATVRAIDLGEYASELRRTELPKGEDPLSEAEIAVGVIGFDPNEPDFYFTLFAELADGHRVTTESLGRWYVGGFPGLSEGSSEDDLKRSVRAEVSEVGESDRWAPLEVAFGREGMEVRREQLEKAPFVVELDTSAEKYVDRVRINDNPSS